MGRTRACFDFFVGAFFLILPLVGSSLIPGQLSAEAAEKPTTTDLQIELSFWESVKDSHDPKMYELYLRKFPDGQFADLARALIEKHGGQPPQQAAPDAETHYKKGTKLKDERKYDLAIAEYTKAIELDPNHTSAYFNRGILYLYNAQPDRAIADYSKVIKINPKHALAHHNRGIAHDNKNKVELAIADYSKAIELNPQLTSAYYNRADLFRKMGKYDRAIADYDKAIEIKPRYAKALLWRASLNAQLGNWPDARRDYNTAQQADSALVTRNVGLLSAHKALESMGDRVPEQVESTIVKVRVSAKREDGSETYRWGEGFFISAQGHVVVPGHLLDKAGTITVINSRDEKLSANVVGMDARTDLALLKIESDAKFPSASLAKKPPSIGSLVFLYGSSQFLGRTFSPAVVSHVARDIGSGPYDNIQVTEIAVGRHGGGPAFNEDGEVIGLMISYFSPNKNRDTGVSFLVPADQIRHVTDALKTKGRVPRGWFGAKVQNVDDEIAAALGLKEPLGTMISDPTKNGPADKAGFKTGDIVLSVNRRKIENSRDFARSIAKFEPGTKVDIGFWRNNTEKSVAVELEEFPLRPTKQEENKSKE